MSLQRGAGALEILGRREMDRLGELNDWILRERGYELFAKLLPGRPEIAEVPAPVDQDRAAADASLKGSSPERDAVSGVRDFNPEVVEYGPLSDPDRTVADVRVAREIDERTGPIGWNQRAEGLLDRSAQVREVVLESGHLVVIRRLKRPARLPQCTDRMWCLRLASWLGATQDRRPAPRGLRSCRTRARGRSARWARRSASGAGDRPSAGTSCCVKAHRVPPARSLFACTSSSGRSCRRCQGFASTRAASAGRPPKTRPAPSSGSGLYRRRRGTSSILSVLQSGSTSGCEPQGISCR